MYYKRKRTRTYSRVVVIMSLWLLFWLQFWLSPLQLFDTFKIFIFRMFDSAKALAFNSVATREEVRLRWQSLNIFIMGLLLIWFLLSFPMRTCLLKQVKEAIFTTLIRNGMFDNSHIRLSLTRGKKVLSFLVQPLL